MGNGARNGKIYHILEGQKNILIWEHKECPKQLLRTLEILEKIYNQFEFETKECIKE
jgi:hypothetical protein